MLGQWIKQVLGDKSNVIFLVIAIKGKSIQNPWHHILHVPSQCVEGCRMLGQWIKQVLGNKSNVVVITITGNSIHLPLYGQCVEG